MSDDKSNPQSNGENTQLVIERMAKCKWITGLNMVKADHWWLTLTDLGRQRIGIFTDALLKISPDFLSADDLPVLTPGSIRQPSQLELTLLIGEIAPILAELRPPDFSPGEADTMISMLLMFARAKGRDQNPPRRG